MMASVPAADRRTGAAALQGVEGKPLKHAQARDFTTGAKPPVCMRPPVAKSCPQVRALPPSSATASQENNNALPVGGFWAKFCAIPPPLAATRQVLAAMGILPIWQDLARKPGKKSILYLRQQTTSICGCATAAPTHLVFYRANTAHSVHTVIHRCGGLAGPSGR